MGYNLWMSDDWRYTLGFRVGTGASAEAVPSGQQTSQKSPERAEPELINFLMESLAHQLQARSATT